jgi:hypothetical protein
MTSFRLAPMSSMIRILTLILLAIPLAFFAVALIGTSILVGPAALVATMYSWVWLRFRPTMFVVRSNVLEVIWPLKRRQIERKNIAGVRTIDNEELRREIGWGVRVGAGGLWGGFGWLWTQRRGIVQLYVSRTSDFVWIEIANERPWLITPEHPETFVRTLSSESNAVAQQST